MPTPALATLARSVADAAAFRRLRLERTEAQLATFATATTPAVTVDRAPLTRLRDQLSRQLADLEGAAGLIARAADADREPMEDLDG